MRVIGWAIATKVCTLLCQVEGFVQWGLYSLEGFACRNGGNVMHVPYSEENGSCLDMRMPRTTIKSMKILWSSSYKE
jgi:hypothetical protein